LTPRVQRVHYCAALMEINNISDPQLTADKTHDSHYNDSINYYTHNLEKRSKKTEGEERETDPHDSRTTERHTAKRKGTRPE